MNSKTRSLFFACLGLLFGMSVMYIYNNFIAEKKTQPTISQLSNNSDYFEDASEITIITESRSIIEYVKKNHKLPKFYVTKNEAKRQGWDPAKGNLCEVLPGKAIGGDHFSNREKKLPIGVQYFEADVNYTCGNRNSHRIVYTKNGEVYLTQDHYRSFEKK
jgi:hypothetical protein